MNQRAAAQREFDAIRHQVRSRWTWLASPRLVVLPNRVMSLYGGAAVMYRWTCISPRLLAAPADVRRAILAHEWGHVVRGHTLATTAAMALAVSSAFLPDRGVWPLVSAVEMLAAGICLLWALHLNREFEADEVAASVVGPAAAARGLRWVLGAVRNGKVDRKTARRLARLEATQEARGAS
ncbi:M48 family metalloprotease [Xanthomonas phaseoli]|uniref:M48 family metalloprotease n=1 Tax=Xanthomonas phaseoli TaxID=1985254 RepID=UPI0002F7B5A2|nr:M48 family metalloprotease [Xanthomonas phaseoli]